MDGCSLALTGWRISPRSPEVVSRDFDDTDEEEEAEAESQEREHGLST